MAVGRDRRRELKYRARAFASELVAQAEAGASGHFDDLEMTHEEAVLLQNEMEAIAWRIAHQKPHPTTSQA